jgi:hypothetical protein
MDNPDISATLGVSQDCLFLITPSVFSNVYLLPTVQLRVCLIWGVYLDCPFLISCNFGFLERLFTIHNLATLGTIHKIIHVQSNIVLSKSNTPTILVFKLSVQMYLTIIMMAPFACICCFPSKHATLRSKSKDWLFRNQNNLFELGDVSTSGLLCTRREHTNNYTTDAVLQEIFKSHSLFCLRLIYYSQIPQYRLYFDYNICRTASVV